MLIIVSPHIRPDGVKHPSAFDANFNGKLICTSETPLLDSARELLKRGLAHPEDWIVMRHVGSDHDALRAKVGMAAKLMKAERSADRLRLEKAPDFLRIWPRIEQTPALVPEAPSTLTQSCEAVDTGSA